jgi:HD-like signal output (HDOD) protein/CheY-like chemotaxis protein
MKRILFVDDEPRVLQGLQRMLHSFRKEWDMDFVEGGIQALALMQNKTYEVIVSDMVMPGMDGAQLLIEVQKRQPNTVRIVLSGHSEREAVLRLVGPAHQYLSKPCNPDLLKETISRAFALRNLLENQQLKNLVSQMETLPSLPGIYLELMDELRAAEPSIENIGDLISKDIALSLKILQMVNSAFFGLPRAISNATEAASYLGLETIRALVLSLKTFSQFEQTKLPGFSLEEVWKHSWTVGLCAKQIAYYENLDEKTCDQCFMAGLFHDIGKLVLITSLKDQCQQINELAEQEHLESWEAESRILGATHAEVGAYLMGLWGLQNPVIEAAALHHRLGDAMPLSPRPLTMVHFANVMEHHVNGSSSQHAAMSVDGHLLTLLEELGHKEEWSNICLKILCPTHNP